MNVASFMDPVPSIRDNEKAAVYIDTTAGVAALILSLECLPISPPSLYIDLEGPNLSRHGSVAVLQIYVLPYGRAYVIDVHRLKEKAFFQPSETGLTLKNILESRSIPKVLFDVRSDSDALYSHFGIELAGIEDLQLMELATRTFSRKLVSGLAKCIERDAPMTPSEKSSWKLWKEKGRKLFSPAQGGSFDIWNVRPLPAEIIEYCVQDVRYLSRLWIEYSQRLTYVWAKIVDEEVSTRLNDSKSSDFLEKGTCRTLGPVGWTLLSSC